MRVISNRVPQNQFERVLLATIGGFRRLDGIVTNNVILPHPTRNLPNEHDLLILLAGRLVTLDAKELWPGAYRDAGAGWEHQREGRWRKVEGFVHPLDVAFKKGKVAEKLVKARLGLGDPVPEVLSCIVVPDACDVSRLGLAAGGRTSLGARFLMLRASEIEDALLADAADFRQRRPTPDELAAILDIHQPSTEDPVACFLGEDLEVIEALEERSRPVPRTVYMGVQHKPRERRVRIEVCPYASDRRPVEALMRAHRSHVVALQEAAYPGVIRLFDHKVAPTATVFVYEFFSRYSVADVVRRRPLAWPEASAVFSKLVRALDAVHAAGVVHRYLDPASILVAGTPVQDIRVCDFFGASAPDVSTLGQDPAASPFDAPERNPDAVPTPSMDWYSAGRCLRFMLTGDPFGVPAGDIPRGLAAALDALGAEAGKRAEGWRRLGLLLGSGAAGAPMSG